MKNKTPRLFLFALLLVGVAILARYYYMKPKYINGEVAPVFEATNIDGNVLKLSDFKGDYVFLDFWGSWCSPCRKENREWVKLYKDIHKDAFSIKSKVHFISVGIERNERNWKNAIQKDGLLWPYHLMDTTSSFRFFDGNISSKYKIRQVPSNYLISPEGMIIGVNMKPKELRRFLRLNIE